MFFIIAILIIIIMDEYMAVSIWLMAVLALDMSIRDERTKPIIYLEVIEDYPIEDCIKPEKFKFLFKKLNTLSYKDIPKEMYFSSIAEYIGFWIYTVLGLIVFLKNSYMASILGIIYFVVVYAIMGIGSCLIMVRKSSAAECKKQERKLYLRYL